MIIFGGGPYRLVVVEAFLEKLGVFGKLVDGGEVFGDPVGAESNG